MGGGQLDPAVSTPRLGESLGTASEPVGVPASAGLSKIPICAICNSFCTFNLPPSSATPDLGQYHPAPYLFCSP